MKKILSIAIASGIVFTIVSFTNIQPGKDKKGDKGGKGQEQSPKEEHGQKGDKDHSNAKKVGGNDNKQEKENPGKANKFDNSRGNGKNGKSGGGNDKDYSKNVTKRGNGNSDKMNGKRDANIDWNLNDFSNRKHPKNQKKVAVCHKPSDGENNGVTINVSENALAAHLNHGDTRGNCAVDNSNRWSSDYIKSRENVYNNYEQTWERMSYSEALLRLAATKLLGIKSNLDRDRSTLSAQEIQRREALIYGIQNNMTSLDNQVGVTRQRLDSDVNIIIKL
jgi:hypothetical protein